MLLIAHMLNF